MNFIYIFYSKRFQNVMSTYEKNVTPKLCKIYEIANKLLKV